MRRNRERFEARDCLFALALALALASIFIPSTRRSGLRCSHQQSFGAYHTAKMCVGLTACPVYVRCVVRLSTKSVERACVCVCVCVCVVPLAT